MYKKILILPLLILTMLIGIKLVYAENVSVNDLIKELKESDLVTKNTEITNKDNKITIIDKTGDKTYQTILEIEDNNLTYAPTEDKEILKNSTKWIDEIIKIILTKNNYDEDIINNLELDKYTFSSNGIEATKNSYIENEEEIYYYFYLKINLNSINL